MYNTTCMPSCGLVLQVRTASCAGTACVNSFGDEQLAVDVLADNLLFDALRHSVSHHVYIMALYITVANLDFR